MPLFLLSLVSVAAAKSNRKGQFSASRVFMLLAIRDVIVPHNVPLALEFVGEL